MRRLAGRGGSVMGPLMQPRAQMQGAATSAMPTRIASSSRLALTCKSRLPERPHFHYGLLGIFLILLAFASVSGAAQRRTDPLIESSDDPTVLQRYAIEFYRQNRPQDALAALSKALSIYPDNAETHMWLGVIYVRLEEIEAADAEFRRALELDEYLTEARNWYGLYWVNQGDLDRAIEQYRLALEDPAYPSISRARVLLNLGNALLQKGDVGAALAPLSEAFRTGVPSNDPLYGWIRLGLGETLLKSGRPEEALTVLAELRVLPDSARVELLTGMAYRDLGEVEKAREHLQRVARLEPGSPLSDQAREILSSLPRGIE